MPTAAERVDRSFRRRYGRGLSEYDIADTPGYWRRKRPCGGLGQCRSTAAHSGWGWEGPILHSASYFDDDTRDPATGRFRSPYRTWRELREEAASVPGPAPAGS